MATEAVKRPMLRLDLSGAMVDLRRSLEIAIREQVSEHVILEVHDELCAPLRQAVDPINDAIAQSIAEALGVPPPRDPMRDAVAKLRAMLEANARERELQRVLVESRLLDPAGTCRAVAEVPMEATGSESRGMRMDLVVNATDGEPAQIIELKRGSHRLLVRRGTAIERVSRPLENAPRQVRAYGDCLVSDAEIRVNIEARHDLALEQLELRLVAGGVYPMLTATTC